jgi:hypothetical protein
MYLSPYSGTPAAIAYFIQKLNETPTVQPFMKIDEQMHA